MNAVPPSRPQSPPPGTRTAAGIPGAAGGGRPPAGRDSATRHPGGPAGPGAPGGSGADARWSWPGPARPGDPGRLPGRPAAPRRWAMPTGGFRPPRRPRRTGRDRGDADRRPAPQAPRPEAAGGPSGGGPGSGGPGGPCGPGGPAGPGGRGPRDGHAISTTSTRTTRTRAVRAGALPAQLEDPDGRLHRARRRHLRHDRGGLRQHPVPEATQARPWRRAAPSTTTTARPLIARLGTQRAILDDIKTGADARSGRRDRHRERHLPHRQRHLVPGMIRSVWMHRHRRTSSRAPRPSPSRWPVTTTTASARKCRSSARSRRSSSRSSSTRSWPKDKILAAVSEHRPLRPRLRHRGRRAGVLQEARRTAHPGSRAPTSPARIQNPSPSTSRSSRTPRGRRAGSTTSLKHMAARPRQVRQVRRARPSSRRPVRRDASTERATRSEGLHAHPGAQGAEEPDEPAGRPGSRAAATRSSRPSTRSSCRPPGRR